MSILEGGADSSSSLVIRNLKLTWTYIIGGTENGREKKFIILKFVKWFSLIKSFSFISVIPYLFVLFRSSLRVRVWMTHIFRLHPHFNVFKHIVWYGDAL